MGLIEPLSGDIFVSGQNLYSKNNLNFWRNCIAHVPQEIYLADISLAKNIALCLDERNIDFKRLQYASKLACIDEFISSTKYGFETLVGERGVLLSGGKSKELGLRSNV